MADVVGRTLGNYRITELIARGGMAAVYKAYQVSLDRYVALKILPESFAYDPTLYDRFEQEAKAAARLRHPSITQVIDFGKDGDTVYLVMEFIDGGTLQHRLKQPITIDDALQITRQVAEALGYAHSHGLVHRDVKPSNILFTTEGHAVLSDFGIAKVVERSVALTRTGVGVGTPEYMSPEQAQGQVVDGRSDIYSLGVVLFEMVTGRVPYESDTPLGVVLKHLNDPLPMPHSIKADVPPAVEKVLVTCLAKSPDKRYQNAQELIRALDACLASRPTASFPAVDGQETLVGPLPPKPALPPARVEAKPKTRPRTPAPSAAKPTTPLPRADSVAPKPKTPPPLSPSPARLRTPPPIPVVEPVAQSKAEGVPDAENAPFVLPSQRATPSVLPGRSGIMLGAGALVVVLGLVVVIAAVASGMRGRAAASTPSTPTAAAAALATSTVAPVVLAPATMTPAPATLAATATPVAMAAMAATATAAPATPAASMAMPTAAGVLTAPPAAPATNVDFKGRIAYTNFRGPDKYGDYDVAVLDLPGGTPRIIAQYGNSPVFSPDGTHILYFSWVEAGFYSMTPDGKNQVTISTTMDDGYPSWSYDGKRIAFTNKGAVWVMNADGTNRTQVAAKGEQPAWSPDNKQLVYVGCVAADCGLVIADADGKNPHLLVNDTTATAPAWAPTENMILYTSRRSGHGELRIIMPDGSMAQALTANLKNAAGQPANSGAAAWSPDGKTIVFRSDSEGWGVYIMSSDGTGVHKVASANVTDEWYKERVSVTK